MRFTYTKHAERRMAQRKITESDIATLVRNCSKPRRDAEGNPIYYRTVYGWYRWSFARLRSHRTYSR